jgi:hypothetical protein
MSSPAENPVTPFAACAVEVRRLVEGTAALERKCDGLLLAPLAGREWYEILQRKLAPQLADEPFLVAAVVGGTNIGKSAIFNHIAGCRASASSPLASGTRHPVCLVPEGFEQRHKLETLFEGFTLSPWREAEEALEETPDHRLFWRTTPELPPNLLVLDTPDIDSDAPVNWLRADFIRHAADVLIAVLTQQKYNDAAVKKFFRKAAAEEKSIIVVFNQCLLPEDEAYWPLWMQTFSRETGIVPDQLYLIPNDRKAAAENRLPVYRREWQPSDPSSVTAQTPSAEPAPPGDLTPHHLARELSDLHFSSIKLRTIRGALKQVLSPKDGLPAWLDEVRGRSASFSEALALLSTQQLARIDNWPAAPAALVVSQVSQWWREQRRGWTRSVHDTYAAVGTGLLWPVRWVQRQVQGETPDPAAAYVRQERDVILQALDKLYDEMTRLSQLGNDLLRPRLERILAGSTRVQLLQELSDAQARLDVGGELQTVVASQMELFGRESPQTFELLKKLDSLAAMARPMTSVVLFFAAGPGGHVLTDAAAHGILGHIVGDIAGGTGAVVVGETALTGAAGGLRYLEARFRQLQSAFAAKRVAWFAEFLRTHLLGPLQEELQTAAAIPQLPEFRQVEQSLAALAAQMLAVPDAKAAV